MFWEKKCKSCNSKADSKWLFCPNCGITLKELKEPVVSRQVDNGSHQLDKVMEMKIPRFMLKPPLKAKGVSITITADDMSTPRINVQTYGEHRHHENKKDEKPVRIPKVTEEPETTVQRVNNKQIITLNLPDVKSLEDIEIKQLHQSVEIKAFAGDKAYFKLIPTPSHATVNNEFKDGVLKIEVMK
ncbi:MAG: zinc ribbon domain-containing protein [Candidatus Aenigmarchaeota archaeon]|nr:zinc ribbon domain-containing protein [Candidatus Aenigmarchaeota archaeon]